MGSQWMMILFVVAAISLAIAPVYWMRPSARQRQLARLREHALQLGLRPELRDTPPGLRQVAEADADRLMKYQWHRPEGDWPRHGESWLAISTEGSDGVRDFRWQTTSDYRAGPDGLLEVLPEPPPKSLYAIEADASGLGFYWHESGDNSRVDDLYQLLGPWVAAYRAQYGDQD